MTDPGPLDIDTTYLRMRGDGSVEPLAAGTDFWPRLMAGQLGTFHHEYLVTTARYEADWPGWEQHPLGDEIVILLSGAVTFVLEQDSAAREVELGSQGAFVLVPRGTWHTARVRAPSRLLFITAGEGTRGRPA
jgi:mannose-6-phosphate isomerase-like protein (cupin superfamily)